MKQQILNQIKTEAKFLAFSETIRPKVRYWLGFDSLNPVEVFEIYLRYINRMKFTIKYAKTIRGQFKIKITKEPLGSQNPFIIGGNKNYSKIKVCYGANKK